LIFTNKQQREGKSFEARALKKTNSLSPGHEELFYV